jgi:hypothetical protein
MSNHIIKMKHLQPFQGISTTIGKLYLWKPDIANDLIVQMNDAVEIVAKSAADAEESASAASISAENASTQAVNSANSADESANSAVDASAASIAASGFSTAAATAAEQSSSSAVAAATAQFAAETASANACAAAESANASEVAANISAENAAASAAVVAGEAEQIAENTSDINSLRGDLNQETNARESDVAGLTSGLSTEVARAGTAEQQNANAISAEVSRATATEQSLDNSKQSNLTTEQLAVINENPLTDDLVNQITGNTSAIAAEVSRATVAENAIQVVIPAAASTSNQLADKNFVNSSIQTMSANSVQADAAGSGFATKAALLAGPYFHNGASYTPTTNDYAVVISDSTAPAPFTNGQVRYQYTGSQWAYEYGINETPFTAAQNNAINSGIVAADKTKLNGIAAGAQVNVLEGVQLNSVDLSISGKKVNVVAQAPLSSEQMAVVNNEPFTAAEKVQLANMQSVAPLDNLTLELNGGIQRVKPQTTLSTISESVAKFAVSTAFAFGDFFNNVVAKINGIITSLNNKVDKVTGKGLSTNDYTTADQTMLANLATEIGNKLNQDLSGITPGGKNSVRHYAAMLDYSAIQNITTGYTATQQGMALITFHSFSGTPTCSINGSVIASYGNNGSERMANQFYFPLDVGDSISWSISNATVNVRLFIPFKN